jgi:hypothetical protein
VHDGLIEKALRSRYQHPVHVANLAIPQHGRNMHYVIIKDMYKLKKPRYLILEVKAYESRKSHHLFSRLADIKDVVSPALTLNIFAPRDLLSAMRWQLSQYISPRRHEAITYESYGFRNNDPGIQLDREKMDALVEKRHEIVDVSYFGGRLDAIEYSLPRSYIRKISDLAAYNNSKLIFLYLPYYGAPKQPRDLNYYQQYGKVWIPPEDVLGDINYWKDAGHLNTNGAFALAPWLSEKLDNELNNDGI